MHAAFLWLFYVLGGLLSLWKRASLSAANPHTPWESVKEYVVAHGPQTGINMLLSTALFFTWWHDPTSLPRLLAFAGISSDASIPINPFLAAVYGVFSEVVMDFFVAKVAAKFPKPPAGN